MANIFIKTPNFTDLKVFSVMTIRFLPYFIIWSHLIQFWALY